MATILLTPQTQAIKYFHTRPAAKLQIMLRQSVLHILKVKGGDMTLIAVLLALSYHGPTPVTAAGSTLSKPPLRSPLLTDVMSDSQPSAPLAPDDHRVAMSTMFAPMRAQLTPATDIHATPAARRWDNGLQDPMTKAAAKHWITLQFYRRCP